jgi:GNAT superfamily N-acetyltransferase
MFDVTEIKFLDILPIWSNYLWLDRASAINPMSSMLYQGGYDMSIYKKYSPIFFGVFLNNKLIGVNSCHCTDESVMRSRGLYVYSQFRKLGIGETLLLHTINHSMNENCSLIWSLARKEALSVYIRAGYKVTSEEIKTETGTNFYVSYNLK